MYEAPGRISGGDVSPGDIVEGGDVRHMDHVERRIARAAAHTGGVADSLRQLLAGQRIYGPLTELVVKRLNAQVLPRLDATTRDLHTYAGQLRTAITTQLNASAAPAAAQQRRQPPPQIHSMTLRQVNDIIADPRNSFDTLAGAYARKYLLEHQDAHRRTGVGTIRNPASRDSVMRNMDCTTFVLRVLKSAYMDKEMARLRDAGQVPPGREAQVKASVERQWVAVVNDARARTRDGRLTGTALIAELQERLDWGAVFWSPDPRNPMDGDTAVHTADYNDARRRGTYWGVSLLDSDKFVVDYRHTSRSVADDMTRLNQLSNLPFGVVAARRGEHMALIVNGYVYEVHVGMPATDYRTIEARPLRDWGWNSGVIAAPRSKLERALP